MIFVVDSEDSELDAIKAALEEDGYEVATFDSADSALDLLDTLAEPELIITEVKLSGMDGFEFKRSYSRRFPNSLTPFVFYTAVDDEQSMGRGLGLGVDDYLIKPMSAKILSIKVRSILNRKSHYLMHTFYGDMAKLPFYQLMQFCESRGLTGEVEVVSGETNILIAFQGGQLQGDEANDEVLLKVYDLSEGTFIVRAMPMDYTELMQYSVKELEEKSEEEQQITYTNCDMPMGKLSGVQLDKKLIQLQTEFVIQPSPQIVTIVVVDGRVMSKKITPPPPGKKLDKRQLERLMEQQHNEVEHEIRAKLQNIAQKKSVPAETPEVRFRKLFEEGFEKYRAEDFAAALSAWQQAYDINPTDKSLETNIRILKKKLNM